MAKEADGRIELSLSWEEWTFSGRGHFSGRADIRNLYTIMHPLETAGAGDFGEISRTVTLPADWEGPVLLAFFATDDHHGFGYEGSFRESLGADIMTGHRFRQVMLDEIVIWDRDVADSDSCETWPYSLNTEGRPYHDYHFVIEIGKFLQPGQSRRLRLRIYDRVASDVRLAGDLHVPNVFEPPELDREKLEKSFDFRSWWGDVRIVAGRSAAERQEGAWRQRFADLLPDREPAGVRCVLQAAAPAGAQRVPLKVVHAGLLPEGVEYPLRGGIPLPPKLICNPEQIRLFDDRGREHPCQVEAKSRWPGDDSIQWVWLHTTVSRGIEELIMECGPGVSRPEPRREHPPLLAEEDEVFLVDTGKVTMTIPKGPSDLLLHSLSHHGQAPCGPVRGVLTEQRIGVVRTYQARVTGVVVEDTGPIHASVCLTGRLSDREGNVFGPFSARFECWRDSELVGLTYRVSQHSEQLTAMVWEMTIEVDGPWSHEVLTSFAAKPGMRDVAMHGNEQGRAEIRQDREDHFELRNGTLGPLSCGRRAEGWFALHQDEDPRVPDLAGGVRWFREQYPKNIKVTPGRLTLGLFATRRQADWQLDNPIYMMTRGESKRHEIWLTPHVGLDPDRLASLHAAWNARPHLFNREWFAASGVMGGFAGYGPEKLTGYDRAVQPWEESEIGHVTYGIREFRDTAWCQNYRGRALNGLLHYFSSGNPQWQAYYEEVMNHFLDIDQILYHPEHPEWFGATHEYCPNHTSGRASTNICTNCADQFMHYYFVGQPDSYRQAVAAADYIADLDLKRSRSARAQGWPLAQLSMAYLWTGDDKYLRAAGDFLKYTLAYIHPYRGAFDETHASFSHRGIVPFMTSYLGYGLIRYHQATSDPLTGRAILATAQAVISETGDGRGGFWYSPNIAQRGSGQVMAAANLGGLFAYAYEISGDRWFADQAILGYKRVREETGLPAASPAQDTAAGGRVIFGLDMTQLSGEWLALLARLENEIEL